MFWNQLHAFKTKIITKSTSSLSNLPNPSAPPYYNVTSTTTPQHRLVLDSNILTPFDFHESPLQSFGPEPSQSTYYFRDRYKILSKFVFKFMSTLILQQGEHISFYLQTDYYDVRATQFSKSKCGRVWRLERIMTRVMTREKPMYDYCLILLIRHSFIRCPRYYDKFLLDKFFCSKLHLLHDYNTQ
jgi:hypothetical protein